MASSNINNSNVNINNLNIITFIKDIYLSLKHIDMCFNLLKNDIDTKIIKLEGQYETILERLSQLENSIEQINTQVNKSSNIDNVIEKELLDKMYKLSSTTEDATCLELKPKELTIANILENSYTMQDIHNSLENNIIYTSQNHTYNKYPTNPMPLEITDNLVMQINTSQSEQQQQTLDSLLFD